MSNVDNVSECVACRSELKPRATICPVCKSNQSSWRNFITFLAGTVGLIALVASAATYVTSTAIGLWRDHVWADNIELVYFTSLGNSLVANTGSGEVFVSQIVVYYKDGRASKAFFANQKIEKGALVSFDTMHPADKRRITDADNWSFLATEADKPITPANYLTTAKAECVADAFISASEPFFARMTEHYRPRVLIQSEATAVIVFVSGRTGAIMSKTIPIRWLLSKHDVAGC